MSFDALLIGMSGLNVNAKKFRTISDNLSNSGTVGFKGSTLQFADMFARGNASQGYGASGDRSQLGSGLHTQLAFIDFKPGTMQATENDLDLALKGDGFFVLKDPASGQISYSRDGRFAMKDGFLVNAGGQQVMALGPDGQLVAVSTADLQVSSPKQTTNATFKDNLAANAATDAEFAVQNVKLIGPRGAEHLIKVTFKKNASPANDWSVTASDTAGAIDTGGFHLQFSDGKAVASTSKLTFRYGPAGGDAFEVTLDFSALTSDANNNTPVKSTVAFNKQDGYVAGTVTGTTINEDGVVILKYTNSQTATGPRLVLARFGSNQDAVQLGGGQFDSVNPSDVRLGYANSSDFSSVSSRTVEGSNVEMEKEFGYMIETQRSYQAAAKIMNTADELLQELLKLGKGS